MDRRCDGMDLLDDILVEAKEWFHCNSLKLNENKTQKMILTTRKVKIDENSTVKFLGMHLMSNLSWNHHIDYLCRKLAPALYTIRRLKQTATYEAARTAYFSYFQSRASYGILLWGCSTAAEAVFIMQKDAVRALSGVGRPISCRNLFKHHNILTLPSIFILSCLDYVHRSQSQFVRNKDFHKYNTRHANELVIPYHRIKTAQLSINHLGIKLYNKLPPMVRALDSQRFYAVVKRYLMERVLYSIDEFYEEDFVMGGAAAL